MELVKLVTCAWNMEASSVLRCIIIFCARFSNLPVLHLNSEGAPSTIPSPYMSLWNITAFSFINDALLAGKPVGIESEASGTNCLRVRIKRTKHNILWGSWWSSSFETTPLSTHLGCVMFRSVPVDIAPGSTRALPWIDKENEHSSMLTKFFLMQKDALALTFIRSLS